MSEILSHIKMNLRLLQIHTTRIAGQISLRPRYEQKENNIRNSVEQSSQIAELYEKIITELNKTGLNKKDVQRYIQLCISMLRYYKNTNARAFKKIIDECKSIIKELLTMLNTSVIKGRPEDGASAPLASAPLASAPLASATRGNIPNVHGIVPSTNSNDEFDNDEINEILGGNAYLYPFNYPVPSRLVEPISRETFKLKGTPMSLPSVTISQLKKDATAANAKAAEIAAKAAAAENNARSKTVTATGQRRPLAGLFNKGGRSRRSRRIHVKPRSRTRKNSHN